MTTSNKVVRVKKLNLSKILVLVPGAVETAPPPVMNPWWDSDNFNWVPGEPVPEQFLPNDPAMTGLLLPPGMSGNRFHRILKDAGIV